MLTLPVLFRGEEMGMAIGKKRMQEALEMIRQASGLQQDETSAMINERQKAILDLKESINRVRAGLARSSSNMEYETLKKCNE